MSLNATTLSAAISIYNTSFGVVSATGVVAPTFSSGTPLTAGVTYALCEEEMMVITAVNGTFITVLRGQLGTAGASHASATPILFGLAVDFPNFIPAQRSFSTAAPGRFSDFSTVVAGAATNVATGARFHLTGTVAMVNLTAPTGFVGGSITIVFDGSASGLTWTAAGNINVAGTATTAGSSVEFFYDPNIQKWIPSRLA